MTWLKSQKPGLPAAALVALRNGQKIEAIKLVRQANNLGLKEAKDTVDAYIETDPKLQALFAEQSRRSARVAGIVFALLGLAVVAGVAWLVLH